MRFSLANLKPATVHVTVTVGSVTIGEIRSIIENNGGIFETLRISSDGVYLSNTVHRRIILHFDRPETEKEKKARYTRLMEQIEICKERITQFQTEIEKANNLFES